MHKKIFNSQITFFIILLIFTSTLSFFLGKLSIITINTNEKNTDIVLHLNEKIENVEVVTSKNGSVYHFPWCSGSNRIKKENRIIFDNRKKAQEAGYRLAKNCEDIKGY